MVKLGKKTNKVRSVFCKLYCKDRHLATCPVKMYPDKYENRKKDK